MNRLECSLKELYPPKIKTDYSTGKRHDWNGISNGCILFKKGLKIFHLSCSILKL